MIIISLQESLNTLPPDKRIKFVKYLGKDIKRAKVHVNLLKRRADVTRENFLKERRMNIEVRAEEASQKISGSPILWSELQTKEEWITERAKLLYFRVRMSSRTKLELLKRKIKCRVPKLVTAFHIAKFLHQGGAIKALTG